MNVDTYPANQFLYKYAVDHVTNSHSLHEAIHGSNNSKVRKYIEIREKLFTTVYKQYHNYECP